jgi:hypothetical protein
VTAEEKHTTSIIPELDTLLGADQSSTPAFLEGLELIRAFVKIERVEDRQKIIELARQLSTTAP